MQYRGRLATSGPGSHGAVTQPPPSLSPFFLPPPDHPPMLKPCSRYSLCLLGGVGLDNPCCTDSRFPNWPGASGGSGAAWLGRAKGNEPPVGHKAGLCLDMARTAHAGGSGLLSVLVLIPHLVGHWRGLFTRKLLGIFAAEVVQPFYGASEQNGGAIAPSA